MTQQTVLPSKHSVVSFRNMEELRKREIIEDYSLTQTTLDEVKLEIIRILVENS